MNWIFHVFLVFVLQKLLTRARRNFQRGGASESQTEPETENAENLAESNVPKKSVNYFLCLLNTISYLFYFFASLRV